MRHAVMTGDDREALWAWLQTPSGEDDPAGWKQVLSALDFRDPRRSQAAAQVGRLRAARADWWHLPRSLRSRSLRFRDA